MHKKEQTHQTAGSQQQSARVPEFFKPEQWEITAAERSAGHAPVEEGCWMPRDTAERIRGHSVSLRI